MRRQHLFPRLSLALVLAVLTACSVSDAFESSSMREVIPSCEVGSLSERDTYYRNPLSGTFFEDHEVLSITGRECEGDGFRRQVEVWEFADSSAAESYLEHVHDLASRSEGARVIDWEGPLLVQDALRTEWRSLERDCAFDGNCQVQDLLEMREGRWLLRVSGVDSEGHFSRDAAVYGGYGVIGNARWDQNEAVAVSVNVRFTAATQLNSQR